MPEGAHQRCTTDVVSRLDTSVCKQVLDRQASGTFLAGTPNDRGREHARVGLGLDDGVHTET